MYNIVGRERVDALRSEFWQEAWEARRQQEAMRAIVKKKKEAQNWEKAKREFVLWSGCTLQPLASGPKH